MTHYAATGDASGLNSNTVHDMAADTAGNIWISTGGGINIYHRATGRFLYLGNQPGMKPLQSDEIHTLSPDEDGMMWIGTTQGLYLYNPKGKKFNQILPDSHPEQGMLTQTVLKDSRGRIWLKTEKKNLWRIDTNGHIENLADQLQDKTVCMLFEDSQGNVWIGSYGHHISYCKPDGHFIHLELDTGEREKGVLPFRTVRCFMEDYDGTIWIGTEVGLLHYHPDSGMFTSLIKSYDPIFPNERVNCVCRDSRGDLWVGTDGGLYRYNRTLDLLKEYLADADVPNSICNNVVTDIHEDHHQRLWIGTLGGLCRYNSAHDTFTYIVRPNEVTGAPIKAILEDYRGQLWISSTNKLWCFDPEEETFHLFNENDGLQRGEFILGAASQGRDGEILLGGTEGANRFFPDSISPDSMPHNVWIEELYVAGRPVIPGDKNGILTESISRTRRVELAHWQSFLQLDFAIHDYLSPEKYCYAYKMEGVDKEWIYTTTNRRNATYAYLAPGTYRFLVKAYSNNGTWNGQPTELSIVIHPPLWRTWWAYLCYLLLAISMAVATVLHLLRKEKSRYHWMLERLKAQQQHEMDELKFQLFTNLSHEFRTSLTLILGPLEYMMKSKGMQGETEQLLHIIRSNAIRLSHLVSQLLDFRKAEVHKLTVHKTTQDIVPFLRNVYENFHYYARQQAYIYRFEAMVESLVFDFDQDKVDKIVYNLLSNAFKYARPQGQVTLRISHEVKESNAYAVISVADNGIGISVEEKEKIFKLFYQAADNGQKYRGGVGLGLSMSHELTILMGGHITVESQPGKGTTFVVRIPIETHTDIKQTSKNPIYHAVTICEQPVQPYAPKEQSKECECILVVEDNVDMQDYIGTILGADYYLIRAYNGKEGLEKAIELMPDIIVTDVMMPEMNGLQLFNRLKNDGRIAHIPVVMLTAVSEESQVVEGFRMGVDDYITKPFNPSILKARIENILTRRQAMWEKQINMSTSAPPTEQELSDYEKKYVSPFMKQMTRIIMIHLADPNLGVDLLASSLHLSTSQLNRKTKALINSTPYNFIIKTRMDVAATMMQESEKSIKEIAYECGYQELSNFSRGFTKYWGESPSQYLKRCRQQNDTLHCL